MHINYLQSSAGWLSNLLWLLSWSHPLFFKHVVKGDSQHHVTFPRCLRWWCLCNYFSLWWTLNSSWGTIWSKQVFPSGDPTSAHMLPFKHLKARLGFFAWQLFTVFYWSDKVFAGEGSAPFMEELEWNRESGPPVPPPSPCVPLCMNALIGMCLFPYLFSSFSLHLALPELAKLESPAVLANLHSLKTCGLPKHYLLSV